MNQLQYLIFKRGVMTTNFNESGAFYYTNPEEPSPDIQLHFAFSMVDQHGLKKHGRGGFTCHICVLRPKSVGSVKLADANPNSPPLIDPAFLKDERDLDTMLAGVKQAQQIMQAPSFDAHRGKALYAGASNDDEELKEDIRNRADTIYHPVGTCKMGPDSDPNAVVDQRLRVRGIKSLRVIDASIMPKIVSGNTNAPSIMIGEKGAHMILEDA
jgi:choline dehydrogenase-like flavoprotein